jgi:hypothetical protein
MSCTESKPRTGTLITGGFRLLDQDGNVVAEGDMPDLPRTVELVEFREIGT